MSWLLNHIQKQTYLRLLRAPALLALVQVTAGASQAQQAASESPATLTITSRPTGRAAVVGTRATYKVVATGNPAALSYQWSRRAPGGTKFIAISGATGSSYTTPPTVIGDNGARYLVRVSNGLVTKESDSAILVVVQSSAISITSRPTGISAPVGTTATYKVVATGNPSAGALSYQWCRRAPGGTKFIAIPGATASSYTTPPTVIGDNGARYLVQVSNAFVRPESDSAILIVPPSSTLTLPTITSQPVSQSVKVGQTATFKIVASGAAPLSYQWKKNGTNVGTNAASYTTPAITMADNKAKISVVVTNSLGHVNSSEATIAVNTNPGSAIIIDHTSTNLPQVPSDAIVAAKKSLRIAYGHTSHGSQLITGMNTLASSNSLYAFNNGGSGGALDLQEAWGIDLGNPTFTQWATDTRTYLTNPANADVNVVIWSWCGELSKATESSVDTYFSLMGKLEQDFPKVKFVYMTGHLDGTGTNGNLNQRNNQIRAYCHTNNKVLFDFADIESYDPTNSTNYMALSCDDGNNYDSDGNGSRNQNWATAWLSNHAQDPIAKLANACGECAHSQTLNCILKARASWWLWARLAGWDGSAATTEPSIPSSPCALNPVSSRSFNVNNYGAKGNGVTDDTAAIQSAVNAAAGTDGKVIIPDGTYMVNAASSIVLKSHMTLQMSSKAILKANSASYNKTNYAVLLARGVDYVNIIGGTITGDFHNGHTGTTGQWGHGLAIMRDNNNNKPSSHIVVQDVKSQYCWGDGFNISGYSENILFCDVTAENNRRSGLSVTDVNRMEVVGSTFNTSEGFTESSVFKCGSGMDIEPNAQETVSALTVTDCTFTGNAGSGVSVGSKAAGTNMSEIVIDGNTVTGNGTNSISATRGIWITGGASGLKIQNNKVQNNRGIGIHVVDADNNSVTGNTVTGTLTQSNPQRFGGGEGILLEKTSGNHATGNTVTGNHGCGIRDAYPTGTNTLSGNTNTGNGGPCS